jgi:IMP and pyridine-specific 5'-nucleotidase
VLPIDPDGTDLMSRNTKIGIVTAAGYTDAERYYGRLHGLLEAIKISDILTPSQKQNLVIMGKYSNSAKFGANDF